MGSGIRRVGTQIAALGFGIIMSHGIAIGNFLRDRAIPFLWDQRPKFVTLLESRIRNLGTKRESAMKKHTSALHCSNKLLTLFICCSSEQFDEFQMAILNYFDAFFERMAIENKPKPMAV